MNEFMLFIKATGNPTVNLPQRDQEKHVQKVGAFIKNLAEQGKMKDAQPLTPNGLTISNDNGRFVEKPIDEKEEMIAGYYHIQAKDLEEATKIAKSDPRFEDSKWSMEIRQIMKIDGINQ